MAEIATENLQANPVLGAMLERRSCRNFQQRDVPDDIERIVLEAGRWAPSADNAQPWYFVVVRGEDAKERMNWAARDSSSLYSMWEASLRKDGGRTELPNFRQVPLCVAVFADEREGPPYVEGEQSHIVAAAMAAQNMWLAAHALGLGATMWSHLEQDQMKSILGVPHHHYFVGVLGIGYPEERDDSRPRERRPVGEVTGYEWFRVRKGQPVPEEKRRLLREFMGI